MKYFFSLLIAFTLTSCVSTKSTLKNIDNTAIRPAVKNNAYIITEYAEDSKYAFHPDYPINIGLILEKQENQHVEYYFNGLTGPNGEKISFKKSSTYLWSFHFKCSLNTVSIWTLFLCSLKLFCP